MKVQNFINEHGWAALADRGILVKNYDNGYRVLNYSQIDARKDDEVACECRGLILDETLNVMCRPFERFFNWGEIGTLTFDFSNCIVQEKVDGSMVKLWFNVKDDRWEIGTKGSAYAEVNHVFGLKTDWTFRDAILDAMRFTEEQFQKCLRTDCFHKSCTYVMEYCSPFNRIVTRYDEPKMVLLAVISNITGICANEGGLREWCDLFRVQNMNIRLPKRYYASSGDEIVAMAESLENLQEGFVIYDINTGQRVKVKSSLYVNAHYLRGNGIPSPTRLMEVVLKNEQGELLSYFKEFIPFIAPIEVALQRLLADATEVYETHKQIESPKDFAIAVKDTTVAAICFKARKDNTTAHIAFEHMGLNQQMKILSEYIGDYYAKISFG